MSSLIPFSQAIKVEKLDSHVYKTNLLDSYCIGTVPNGGYSASCLLEAARLHMASKNQKDAMTSHFQFLNRTEVGPAIIVISDVKPGRQFSMLHLTLYQRGLLDQAPWVTQGTSRAEITAYLTMTDLSRAQGLTLPTMWSFPSKTPTPDFSLLKADKQDGHWRELNLGSSGAFGMYARVLDNCHFYFPKRGQEHPSVIDLWMRFKIPSEGFTNSSLGLVSDAFPYVVEAFRPPPDSKTDKPFKANEMFWYPTVVMSLELKRALPEKKGVEWLRLRMQSKEIRNGRLDLEVVIVDARGELVGVSNQVNLILGSERNTGGRENGKI
ncbi:thioesterase-like superfamily-domain-containing protein [Triangularia verruculosa]|uniref:Thioesterase-like superfamily-domain-containing protein n=1 Tax=Triangularia verruculosa TaxID=2587418 RepID=A0AAN6X904_9PEZI|nr:thioesterase-like superfamily-domain-containing protein [Triangularia verruculosa]